MGWRGHRPAARPRRLNPPPTSSISSAAELSSVAEHETRSAAATEQLAAELARSLGPGDVVLLAGGLGAGKTTFVRGACIALGVSEPVTSPTFAIGQRYEGRLSVSHLDLYRLGSLDEEEPGLLDDYLTAEAVAFVEWPEAAARSSSAGGPEGLQRPAAIVRLEHAGGDRRRIEIETRR